MISRLRQNLGVKLLSLGCSFALFQYVHKQNASELTFMVPLTVLHDQSIRIVEPVTPRTMVRVTLLGPADRLKLAEAQTKAIVDLRGQPGGIYRPLVEVPPPEPREKLTVNFSPQVVNVQLEGRKSRQVRVQTTFNVPPPAGLSLGTATVEPPLVSITGWESDVNRVKGIQAVVNTLGPGGAVDVDVPVRAVDSQGLEVDEGLQIQPQTVRIRAPLERSVWSKPVLVSASLMEPPPTVRIRRVTVTPRRLTLRGSEGAVGPVQYLETEPIPIPNTPEVVDREARVILPAGVRTEERPVVRIVVTLTTRGKETLR